jgi:hypothetical protein
VIVADIPRHVELCASIGFVQDADNGPRPTRLYR